MADEDQLRILKRGVAAWNDWRSKSIQIRVDLIGASLRETDLRRVSLTRADLFRANLTRANLTRASLSVANLSGVDLMGADLSEASVSGADLIGANLSGANLIGANLSGANLSGANLSGADLGGADLGGADLSEANLIGANLIDTVFADVDLSGCKGLERCLHMGPSIIDIRTLQRSGSLPLAFLRGVGLPDTLIDYLPSLLGRPIQHYSCFISYSSKDDEFVYRLHADLQNNGIRCWFAPHDMKIGAKIRDTIDDAIRLRDKVLIVLSEVAIASDWVEDEVDKAFEEERQRSGVVLFPVRLDDTVLTTNEAWAAKLRRSRNIGDSGPGRTTTPIRAPSSGCCVTSAWRRLMPAHRRQGKSRSGALW